MRGLTPKQRSLLLKEWRRLHALGIEYSALEDIPADIFNAIDDVHPTEAYWYKARHFFEKENDKELAHKLGY
jgi:hypothetical protein